MPFFSKTLLPPILEYTYPAFDYEKEHSLIFYPKLSITNTVEQVDHIQIRIVSLNTDKNALNPLLFPTGFFFQKAKGPQLKVEVPTFFLNKYTFGLNDDPPYPSYYKIQIRLGIKNENNYLEEWGQQVEEKWIKDNSQNFSEWSNSSIIKTTKEPNFGLFGLKEKEDNILAEVDFLWKGYYSTEDNNETLKKYSFDLYDNKHSLIESSEDFYIGEYELPSIVYKINEILKNNQKYFLRIIIETATDYKAYKEYPIVTNFSYIKIYNILNIREDEDLAANILEIKAKQTLLESSEAKDELEWLADSNMDEYGETGITHLIIKEGEYLRTPRRDFSIPYNDFSIILSISNFKSKKQKRLIDCFKNNNWLLRANNESNICQFYLGYYERNGKDCLVLRSSYKDFLNYYYIDLKEKIQDNQEFLINITSNKGKIYFNAIKWHDNIFKK